MQVYREAVRQADNDDDGSGPRVGMPDRTWNAPEETVPPAQVSGSRVSRTRGQKPWFPSGQSVDQYSSAQLAQMVRWVESDGCLRTDEEIVTELQVLGFKRRGNRIVAAIKTAIPYARRQP